MPAVPIVTFSSGVNPSFVVVKFYEDVSGTYVEQSRFDILYGEYESVPEGAADLKIFNRNTSEILIQYPWAEIRMDNAGFSTFGFNQSGYLFLNIVLGGGATSTTPTPAPNQFYYAQAGGTTVAPETSGDTLNFAAGAGLSVSANATTDTITFSNTRTTSGTAPIQTAVDLSGNTTITIDPATTSTAGSMSAADKTKLDGITAGAAVASVTGTAPIASSGGANPAISISAATTSAAGSMSAADKTKLDGIAAGAEVNVNADWNASSGDALILNKPTIPAQYSVVVSNSALSYGLVLADANEFMVCDSTSNFTITIPLNSSQAFAVGTEIAFMQRNTGTVTIQGAGGVSLFSSQTARTAKQHAVIAIKKIDTDAWVCVGDRLAL